MPVVKTSRGELVLEPPLDLEESPEGIRWLGHSQDRCEFAGLTAAELRLRMVLVLGVAGVAGRRRGPQEHRDDRESDRRPSPAEPVSIG